VLSEFAGRIAGAFSTEEVLPRMARMLVEATGARRAGVWLHSGGTERMEAAWPAAAEATGPPAGPVAADSDQIRIRMGSFRLDILRGSVRSASRSRARLRGTTGVHGGRGRWLVNGSADGLVELAIEPPRYLDRGLSTLFRKEKASSLTLSLVDPDGFIAAVERDGHS
jgi:hypothetical protein